jgi:hypothetical protein
LVKLARYISNIYGGYMNKYKTAAFEVKSENQTAVSNSRGQSNP